MMIQKRDVPKVMNAIVTQRPGDYEVLSYQKVQVPQIGPKDVLIKVLACAVNNTDINARIGWYGKEGTGKGTNILADNPPEKMEQDGGWQGKTLFPFIQGTDCCGIVVQVGEEIQNPSSLMEKRVLVRPCQRIEGFHSFKSMWMGSDYNGSFAEYVKVPANEVFVIHSSWTDIELATIPCAYGTSEAMLCRAKLKKDEHVLIVGASGGVGSATIQLALKRNAIVHAITSENKKEAIRELGCHRVYSRNEDLIQVIGENTFDVVVDNVGGVSFSTMLKLLKPGGRYVTSGAIGGAQVSLDMRDLYLKDLQLIGSTCWGEEVFPNVISYIEKNEIKPLVDSVYPLERITEAQQKFLLKNHIGKIVLIPGSPSER